MKRLSLADAKMVLRNRGWQAMPVDKRYDIYDKDGQLKAQGATGYDVVRMAKLLLL